MFQLNLFETGREKTSNVDSSKQLLLELCTPTTGTKLLPKKQLIIEVGSTIAQLISQNKLISSNKLSELMSAAAKSTDAEGAWLWKDAYEASEVGLIFYLRRHRKTFLKHSPTFLLKHLLGIQALLPTQTRRSEDQVSMQHFSTPISLAFCATYAAQITSEDCVLEPSAGTGLLGIWAELAGAKLILNELSQLRRKLLADLFPKIPVSGHNAEQINDYLTDSVTPSIVIINPPFSSSPKREKRNSSATLQHIKSALIKLQPGGRLVAITAILFNPNNKNWRDLFENQLGKYGSVAFSVGIEGKAYAKHGTNIDTRLTVFDMNNLLWSPN